jgi:D-alanyl-D-alanine dipeptidase
MSRIVLLFLLCARALLAQEPDSDGSRADEPMVNLAEFAPRILIELRYATDRNIAKRPIYPAGSRAFLRKGVAERLLRAQHWLDENAPKGTRIKIWDAWRPVWAHQLLWRIFPNGEYLRDPAKGGSLHSWGTCVDATLVDKGGRELKMPTDFDVFTADARTYYKGKNREVAKNVRLLQSAMSKAGFMVVYDEWWHFVARDWETYGPVEMELTK